MLYSIFTQTIEDLFIPTFIGLLVLSAISLLSVLRGNRVFVTNFVIAFFMFLTFEVMAYGLFLDFDTSLIKSAFLFEHGFLISAFGITSILMFLIVSAVWVIGILSVLFYGTTAFKEKEPEQTKIKMV